MPERWIPSSHGFQVVTEDSMHSIALVKSTGDADSQFKRAALLAAAPDLLAACEEAVEYTLPEDTRDRLRAAIAKAREGGTR